MINLPQIYNTTMAEQWRYISLTGVRAGPPEDQLRRRADGVDGVPAGRVVRQPDRQQRVAGDVVAAARRARACGPRTLPYSTDLRIDS